VLLKKAENKMELTEWVRLGGKSSTEMPQAIAVYSVVCGWFLFIGKHGVGESRRRRGALGFLGG